MKIYIIQKKKLEILLLIDLKCFQVYCTFLKVEF